MTNPGDLQFDRAEPTQPMAAGTTCAACKQPLRDAYYEVNGRLLCTSCRARLEQHVTGGSFANALLLGLGAAVLGAGIYFAIELLTGYEFGLVAVVVGLLVGTAVRKASRGAGGWRYQALAIGLTYLAVVVTDGSLIIRAAIQEARHPSAARPAAVADSSAPPTAPGGAPGSSAESTTIASTGETPATPERSPLVAILLMIGFLIAAPVMIGISSPLHFVIVGFALYEAWKLNRTPAFKIAGPYQLAAP
jgi:hypothetical protein